MSNHYVENQEHYLKTFDRTFELVAKELSDRHDQAFVEEVIAEARMGFIDLLPRLPYIGGNKNAFSEVITINAFMIPLWKSLNKRGYSVEEFIQLCVLTSDDVFSKIPGFLRKFTGKVAFNKHIGWPYFRKQAEQSQRQEYERDFIYTADLIEDGKAKTLKLTFSQCAVMLLYDQEEVTELKPYCNFFDALQSKEMGWGVDAHHTIGLGNEECILAYNNTQQFILSPQLRDVYEEIEEKLGLSFADAEAGGEIYDSG